MLADSWTVFRSNLCFIYVLGRSKGKYMPEKCTFMKYTEVCLGKQNQDHSKALK